MTEDKAKQMLERDIAKAYELYEARMERVRRAAQLPPKPTARTISAPVEKARARRRAALEMSRAGMTFRAIGAALGVSGNRASQIVTRAKLDEEEQNSTAEKRPLA